MSCVLSIELESLQYIRHAPLLRHTICSRHIDMKEKKCSVEQSACNICTEDVDASKLLPSVTEEEKIAFGGVVDAERICMFSLLQSRFIAKTYNREVVALHDVVPGPVVPRCWLHKDVYDQWLGFMKQGHQAVLCPGCNRGLLIDKDDGLILYDKYDINARTPCGVDRNLTPLYVAVEANLRGQVSYLLSLERQPRIDVDGTSEIDNKVCTPLRCAAQLNLWPIVEDLMDAGARADLKVFDTVTQDNIMPNTTSGNTIMCLAVEAQQWDIASQLILNDSHGELNQIFLMIIIAQAWENGNSILNRIVGMNAWLVFSNILGVWSQIDYKHKLGTMWSPHYDLSMETQGTLIEVAGKALLAPDHNGFTVMHHLTAYLPLDIPGTWRSINFILDFNQKADLKICVGDITLLQHAFRYESWQTVLQMLCFDNILRMMTAPDNSPLVVQNQDMLFAACKHARWDIVTRLLTIVDPSFMRNHGKTPFLMAALDGAWEPLNIMLLNVSKGSFYNENRVSLDSDRDIILQKDLNGDCVLMLAADAKKWEVVWMLLTHFRADILTTSSSKTLFYTVLDSKEWPLAQHMCDKMGNFLDRMPHNDLMQHLQQPVICNQWKLVSSLLRIAPGLDASQDVVDLLYDASSKGEWEVVFWVLLKAKAVPIEAVVNRMAVYAREQQEMFMLSFLYTHGATLRPEDGDPYALWGSNRGYPTASMLDAMKIDAGDADSPGN